MDIYMNKSDINSNRFIIEWNIIMKDYIIRKILGTGSYGCVVEASHKNTGHLVAIKRITSLFEDFVDTKRILREITLLRFMRNPFIVKLLDIVYDQSNPKFDTIFLVFEYAPSDLKKVIKSSLNLELIDVKKLVYHILCGLKYIHSCAVLHRDLKPGNILIDNNHHIKICDFGLARSVSKVDEDETTENKMEIDSEDMVTSNKFNQRTGKYEKFLSKSSKIADSQENISNGEKKDSVRPPFLKKENKKSKQILTVHVVTRWYRAPELILVEKEYNSSIDVWSVGCIFAELMTMMKENAKTHLDRNPLFPGKFCFPLSPPGNTVKTVKINEYGFPIDHSDQLNVIFDVIGTPSDEDMSHITDNNGVLYLKSLNQRSKIDLKSRFPGSSDDSLELLDRMLQFSPYKRITVQKALEHRFFKEIRLIEKEIEADFNLEFEYEKDEFLTMEKIRVLLLQVIESYKI